jgi:2,4-dienoyl-CoA reductase-like NADH-dependent reductase (Old Yellow Enzyme family)
MKIEMTFPTVANDHSLAQVRAIRPESSPVLASFSRSSSLEMSLAEVPDVRASAVARGRALIADPNYPSKAQVKKIARLLVASGLGR